MQHRIIKRDNLRLASMKALPKRKGNAATGEVGAVSINSPQ